MIMITKFKLPISIFKEGNYFVAYCQVLDLATSAKSFAKVKQRFVEVVQVFMEELAGKGTIDEVLLGLGWQKIRKDWQPPVLISQTSEEIKINFSSRLN